MDLATLVGLIGGFIVVGMAIAVGGSAGIFVNIPSILIVIIGSMFVVSMRFSLFKLKNAFKVAIKAFLWKSSSPQELISQALSMAKIASCLLYTSPSPRDQRGSRMPSSA